MYRYYHIAGLGVVMDTFGRTKCQAEKYLSKCELLSDIVIESARENLKNRYPHLSEDEAEYLGTGVDFYKKLLDYDGTMMHASAVVVSNKAYLFSAHSGTGKSTHTGLWLKLFENDAYILNDDKPALRFIDDTWYAFGTPWSGKNDISVNNGVQVAGIAIIERSEENTIVPYSGKEAIFEIYSQILRPKDQLYRYRILELIDKIMTRVPVWKLKCNMKDEAAIVSYEAMSGSKWKGLK